MTSGNYPPKVKSPEEEDWKKRLKVLGIVRKRRPKGEKKREDSLRKVKSGREGEDIAALLLEENSLRILYRNVRYPDGEIDIVALDGATTVFVEVKRRRDGAFGTPAEAVTRTKSARVVKAARRWLAAHPARAGSVRFDVVAVRDDPPAVEWLRGAFDASR
jgi:putative endonuclease